MGSILDWATIDRMHGSLSASSAISSLDLRGWIELGGIRLSNSEVLAALSQDPGVVLRFGGEFFLKWNECSGNECAARDHFGIMPGECPPGALVRRGEVAGKVDPGYCIMDLEKAIEVAVRLRNDEGVVALSGGVDSALVAKLAERECVVVGLEGSHDLLQAALVADELELPLEQVVIDPGAVEDALRAVLRVIPKIDPVNASIATTLFFVARWAGEHGHRRILAGQGADELFGGYSRYLQTQTLGRGYGKRLPWACLAACSGSGSGEYPWCILLPALHGSEGSKNRSIHSAGDEDPGQNSQATASGSGRATPSGVHRSP